MAFAYSPKIVTDGLVFAVDAANKKSYPGSGTTWTDLAGSNDGTLTNGPTFDSDSGGSIVFDGTDDYIELGSIDSTNSLMLNGSDLTISAWVYFDGSGDRYQRLIDKSSAGSATNGYSLWVDFQSDGVGYSVNGNNSRTNTMPSSNAWSNIVVVANQTSATSYINLSSISNSYYAGSHTTPPNSTQNCRMGTWNHSTGRELNGNMAMLQIHNRALSVNEITQNYNALKSRFEL